ncbi:MAG: hypothetical protein GY938_07460 [Ketobacter sp.]|nr:hypothetical protein [Ketobacter sp.]
MDPIWDFFTRDNTNFTAKCNHCPKHYNLGSTMPTTNLVYHIKKHPGC